MFCNQCGASVKEGVAFCNNCGNKLYINGNTQATVENIAPTPRMERSVTVDQSTWIGSLPFFANAKMILTKKYATFSGRATRGELWKFALFQSVLMILLLVIANAMGLSINASDPIAALQSLIVTNIALVIVAIILSIPGIAVTVRRLHDIGKSGWCYWIQLIPLIGPCVLLYWMCKSTQFSVNKYGPILDYSQYKG